MRFSKTWLILAASGEDTTNPKAHGAKIYLDPANHATAAASILHYAAKWADYAPASSPPPKSTAIFEKYEEKAISFPGFKTTDQLYEFPLLHGGLDDLESKILDSYHGFGRRDIANGLRSLIPKTNKDPTLQQWILTLPIIIKRHKMDEVTVKLVSLALHLKTDDDGKVELPGGQIASLKIVELQILPEELRDHAEKLAEKLEQTSIARFEAYFTSKWDEGHHGDDKKKKMLSGLEDWLELENWDQAILREAPGTLW
ncbi:hypothetical protein DFQ26_000175 [Actinomortierella ambigua]|nr:hypothetical protein DFQ26_000175 [Actinomortierella ambigua]